MIYVRLHLAVYPGAEQPLDHALVSIEDVTARRKAEEYLRYLGTHDVMTGLYNRAHFEEDWNPAPARESRLKPTRGADAPSPKRANGVK